MPFLTLGCSVGFNAVARGLGDYVVASAYGTLLIPESANVINAKVYTYYAQSLDGSQWESGSGSYNIGTDTLARTTITASSNDDGSKVDFATIPMVYVFSSSLGSLEISTAHLRAEQGTGVAAAGEFGETYVSSFSTQVTTTSVAKMLGSIPVPSGGDWEVSGVAFWSGSGTTTSTDYYTLISSSATPTFSTNSIDGVYRHNRMPSANDYALVHSFTPWTFGTAAATTLYMHGLSAWSSGIAPTAVGYIRIKRER